MNDPKLKNLLDVVTVLVLGLLFVIFVGTLKQIGEAQVRQQAINQLIIDSTRPKGTAFVHTTHPIYDQGGPIGPMPSGNFAYGPP